MRLKVRVWSFSFFGATNKERARPSWLIIEEFILIISSHTLKLD
jgi:hypothetical protein